jgi:hypothetical protein
MKLNLFADLERAISDRNPVLARRLRPGRSEEFLRKRLKREGVNGCVEPIVALFSWKDGTNLDNDVPPEQVSPFPGSGFFMFMPFGFTVGHFGMFLDFAKHHENLKHVAGRYFPLFWNGSKGVRDWIAVDLDPCEKSRVVLLNHHDTDPVYPAYPTFEAFIEDAIRANRENTNLSCL